MAKKQEETDKRDEVEKLLLENEELLADIAMEYKYRKNKNIINSRLSLLINKLERNLIQIAKDSVPLSLADPQHVIKEKERFMRFYQRRNGKKGNNSSSRVK